MIKLYIFLLSLGLSFLTVYFSFNFSVTAMVFLYITFSLVYILAFILLFFIIWGLLVCRSNKKEIHAYSRYYRFIMHLINIVGISLFNIKVKYSGIELVDKVNSNFLLVSNHHSNLDSVVADHYLRKHKLIFIGKKELFNIPFVGKTISGIGYLPLDRKDIRQEAAIIKKATGILENSDVSIGIYPEGSRSKEINGKILELKAGSFRLAINNHKPIVVSIISYNRHITNIFKRIKCWYKIVKVITYDEYKNYSPRELANYIQGIMQEEKDRINEQK